ncbi:MAG: AAA family ATPase, partial [Succinivibrionaceae bacterium]
MGNILNPCRDNSFTELIEFKDSDIFVDKTCFIDITNKRLNKANRFMAVTRPRRFGKTVTAQMLSTYYSKG